MITAFPGTWAKFLVYAPQQASHPEGSMGPVAKKTEKDKAWQAPGTLPARSKQGSERANGAERTWLFRTAGTDSSIRGVSGGGGGCRWQGLVYTTSTTGARVLQGFGLCPQHHTRYGFAALRPQWFYNWTMWVL